MRCSLVAVVKKHTVYVITVVDKAAGNFAFTCKKFYYLRLAQELGLDNPTPGNDTYEYQGSSESDVCQRLVSELSRFKANPDNSNMRLALLYHNPKFHKTPIKFRFITVTTKKMIMPLMILPLPYIYLSICKN